MSFQKIQSDSYCIGGRHRSATKIIHGDIISKGKKIIFGYCSINNCIRKKSMTVSDNTIQAKSLGDFIKSLARKRKNGSKKIAKNLINNPEQA